VRTHPGNLDWRRGAPDLPIPGGGSDHAPFLNFLGIPVINFEYHNATKQDYPLYHSLYETRFVNSHIIDTNNLAVTDLSFSGFRE
jgi:N-acetylated-alpha-linked acidic dipeptidase